MKILSQDLYRRSAASADASIRSRREQRTSAANAKQGGLSAPKDKLKSTLDKLSSAAEEAGAGVVSTDSLLPQPLRRDMQSTQQIRQRIAAYAQASGFPPEYAERYLEGKERETLNDVGRDDDEEEEEN